MPRPLRRGPSADPRMSRRQARGARGPGAPRGPGRTAPGGATPPRHDLPAARPGERSGAGKRPRLLLVGPLASLRRRLAPTYAVTLVPTVRAASAALSPSAPHLVVAAAELPDGTGLSVVEAVDRRPAAHRPPVVVLSATDSEPFVEAAAVALAALAGSRRPGAATESAFDARVAAAAQDRLGDPAFGPTQLAAAVGLSPRHLRRRLADATGEGPGDLLRRLRFERAVALLAAGARVKEAGHLAGFGGPAAFRAAFRRRYGVSPSAYARSGRAASPAGDAASGNARSLSGPDRFSDGPPGGTSSA